MKKIYSLSLLAILATSLSGCSVVEGIFKTGVWTGIILVVLVIAVIIWVISKLFGGRG